MRAIVFLGLALHLAAGVAQESRPRSYEEEVVYHLVERHDGEVVRLKAGGREFLGLFREASRGNSMRAAVILHGMGGHADWPDVIGPLRTALPEQGWATLSIQLPVLAPDRQHSAYGRTLPAAGERIGAALRHLEEIGYDRVALIGYSFGATSALEYLEDQPAAVETFVGISMQDHLYLDPPHDLIEQLPELKVPALDIYGSRDFSGVVRSVDDRRLAGSRVGHPPYDQQVIDGADHYFSDAGGELAAEIAAWLNRVVPDIEPENPGEIDYL